MWRGTLPLVSGFEYRRATWDEVVQLGAQGWRMVPIPPIVEMRPGALLNQMQQSEPLYTMERELAAGAGTVLPGAVLAGGRP